MKIKNLLHSKKQWTKSAQARDSDGAACDPKSSKAVQWCLLGAVIKAYGIMELLSDSPESVYNVIKAHMGVLSLTEWNDSEERTFKEVRKLIKTLNI